MSPATGSGGGPPTALARGKTGRRNLKCGAGARVLLLGACQWGAPLPLSLELGARINREDRLSSFSLSLGLLLLLRVRLHCCHVHSLMRGEHLGNRRPC